MIGSIDLWDHNV